MFKTFKNKNVFFKILKQLTLHEFYNKIKMLTYLMIV